MLKIRLSLITIAAASLSGCAAIDTAQNVYTAAKTGYTVKSAVADVKDIRDAQPVFSGMTSVAVSADLYPRNQARDATTRSAFIDSMSYQVEQLASAAGARLYSCPSLQTCGGRVLSIQFREEGYAANWAEKATMGSQLKGKLLFVDGGTGQVIGEKRVEGVNTYSEVLGLIRGSLLGSMAKSFPTASIDALNQVRAVRPGYESLLSGS